MVGCRPEPVGADGPATRRAIGDTCRKNSDCIEGAACLCATCDFPAPCSISTTRDEGTSVTTTRFDARGREVGLVETRDGAVLRREEGVWSSDGKVSTWKGWDSPDAQSPDRRWEMRYDARGDLTEIVEEFSDGEREVQRFTWSEDWSCPMPTTIFERRQQQTRSRVSCERETATVEHLNGDGEVTASGRYVFKDGRVVERLTELARGAGDVSRFRMQLERDGRGALTGMTVDVRDDGTEDERLTYDRTCWKVEGDRVVHVAP